jgi:hypothetical protein
VRTMCCAKGCQKILRHGFWWGGECCIALFGRGRRCVGLLAPALVAGGNSVDAFIAPFYRCPTRLKMVS